MPTQQIDHDPANGCPKCGGALWDNRDTKKNPKAPDYKCRDKNCDGVIWPPKGGATSTRFTPAALPQGKAPHSAGPYIEGLDEAPAAPTTATLDKLFALYSACYAQAHHTVGKAFAGEAPSQVAVCAAAATLFIAAKERGLAA